MLIDYQGRILFICLIYVTKKDYFCMRFSNQNFLKLQNWGFPLIIFFVSSKNYWKWLLAENDWIIAEIISLKFYGSHTLRLTQVLTLNRKSHFAEMLISVRRTPGNWKNIYKWKLSSWNNAIFRWSEMHQNNTNLNLFFSEYENRNS